MNNLVKSAVRVLDVLETLAVSPQPLGVTEIARRLDIPKSSASMLLGTLEARGYVTSDQSRRFRLQPAFGDAGGSWIGGLNAQLLRVARPIMRALVQSTGESSFLGVLTPDWRLQYIEKVVSPNEVRFDADIVAPRPLHCTSVGLAILAFQPAERIDAFFATRPLGRLTANTITDPARLREELDAIRKRGYAESKDAHVIGASGFAAPIFGPDGRVVAGINVSAPSARCRDMEGRMKEELLRAARKINRLMLGPEPPIERPGASRATAAPGI